MADDEGVAEQAKRKATERVTLARGEVWLLRVAAATGIVSAISHGIGLLHYLGWL